MNTLPPSFSRRALLRSTAVAAFAVSGAGLLTACAGSSGDSGTAAEGKVTADNPFGVAEDATLDVVVFKGGYSDDYAKFDEKLYAKKFPKAKVSHSGITEIGTELQPRFVAGDPPDVVDNSGAKKMVLGTLVADGQLANLSDLLKAPSADDPDTTVEDTLLPGALAPATFDGKVVGLPYVFTVHGFWYSKTLFDKHGWTWPTTWDGLTALAAKIKKAGIAPFAYGGTTAPDYYLQALLALAAKQGGADVIKAIDNLEAKAWQAEPVQAATEAIASLASSGYFLKGSEGLDHTQAQTAWVQGKAAMYHSGSFIENEMKSITPDGFDMVFGTVPPLSATGSLPQTALYAIAGEIYVVPAKAKNVRGGKEYLRTMLSKKAAVNFTKSTHALTIVKGATGDEDFGSTALGSVTKAIDAAGDDLFSHLFTSWYADLSTTLKTEMANLLAGRTDAADFLSKMQAKADTVAADSSITKFKR
ncbi:N-acetylglucosamine/diacetylchitobiose ABC transporter substrate-binding protein [Streptomyces sp. NPDC058256]|uniref:N-acetylglucosamine/diacetylchitobiose ABC transporter substrate-binding protein n=1 Tax=Streptomyces sp. NPDC058256 TaxID=3346408 RepID=UPI0036E39646